MNHDIFISYSSKQKSIADGVCHYLEEKGFKCWMAPRDIPAGSEYGNLIEDAIKACKVVVLVFSEAASMSKWVKGEINVAFTDDKPILPFRVDETEIKGSIKIMLNQMHWIDAFPHYADRLPDLLSSISSIIGKQPEPVQGTGNNYGKERRKVGATLKPKRRKVLWIALCIIIAVIVLLILIVLKKPNLPLSSHTVSEDLVFTVNGVSFVMKPVEGGAYQMGSNEMISNEDERPSHRVELSSFYIGETEVTQALWKAVMGSNPSIFKGDSLPVENVNWDDCKVFFNKLNDLTGHEFRMPTEAEWEYAARGGKLSLGNMYSGSDSISNVAWFADFSMSQTHKVKTLGANELGIYDMSGNVWEWCGDYYGNYSKGSQTNPRGPLLRRCHVLRGGSWVNRADFCRVSYRGRSVSDNNRGYIGFRLVLPLN